MRPAAPSPWAGRKIGSIAARRISSQAGHLSRCGIMGIRFHCSTCGHKLNVKVFQAGRRGLCPYCGASIHIPTESTRPSSKRRRQQRNGPAAGEAPGAAPGPGPLAPGAIGSPAGPAANGPGGPDLAPAAAPLVHPAQTAPADAAGTAPQPATLSPANPGAPSPAKPGAPSLAEPGAPMASQPLGPAPAGTWGESPGPAPAQPYPAASAAPVPTPAPPPTPASPPTPDDPLAEAPGAVWYVRAPGGGQYGPAAADVMRVWLDEGRVSPDSLVWREGWRDWMQAAEVFAQLSAGQLDPELGAIAAENAASAKLGGGPYRRPSRGRSTTLNAAIITVLILAVIILLMVFIWVLQKGPRNDTDSSAGAGTAAAAVVERRPAR